MRRIKRYDKPIRRKFQDPGAIEDIKELKNRLVDDEPKEYIPGTETIVSAGATSSKPEIRD